MPEVYPEMVSQLNAEAFGHVMILVFITRSYRIRWDFNLQPWFHTSTKVTNRTMVQRLQLETRVQFPLPATYGRSWKKRMLTFQAYYIRHKLKKQIILFNNLLQHQYSDQVSWPSKGSFGSCTEWDSSHARRFSCSRSFLAIYYSSSLRLCRELYQSVSCRHSLIEGLQ